MDKDQIKALLAKYEAGTCTREEKALLETWFLRQRSKDLPALSEIEEDLNEVWAALNKDHQKPSRMISWPRIAAVAASVIFCLSVGGYFLMPKKQAVQQTAQNRKNDLAPGGNKAILTLANGTKIVLTDAKNGKVASQGDAVVNKKAGGQLVYEVAKSNQTNPKAEIQYNTLTTPRAGVTTVILSDGTKVWLNAATTIRYPASFTGNERKVALITGEAYFKVVHNVKMPFRVVTPNQTIEDIGTEFNVNAYPDEPALNTTLIDGSIKISAAMQSVLLRPGQQTVLVNNHFEVKNADLEVVAAWKNGLFSFKDAGIREVMRQISRWYDVDVSYEGNLPKRLFNGEIHRNVKASQVLDILSYYKVHFRISEKKIIVTE